MLTQTLAPSDRAQALLTAAQQKLRATDSPKMLRFTAFLRLSCLTLEQPGAFADLMHQLSFHQNWWLTCEVTSDGTLKSSHSAINFLLEPINALHRPQSRFSPLPLAA